MDDKSLITIIILALLIPVLFTGVFIYALIIFIRITRKTQAEYKDLVEESKNFKVDFIPEDLFTSIDADYLNNADDFSLILRNVAYQFTFYRTELILQNNQDKLLYGKFFYKPLKPAESKAEFHVAGNKVNINLNGGKIWEITCNDILWAKAEMIQFPKSVEHKIKLIDGRVFNYPKANFGSFRHTRGFSFCGRGDGVECSVYSTEFKTDDGKDYLQSNRSLSGFCSNYYLLKNGDNLFTFDSGYKWFTVSENLTKEDLSCLLAVYFLFFSIFSMPDLFKKHY